MHADHRQDETLQQAVRIARIMQNALDDDDVFPFATIVQRVPAAPIAAIQGAVRCLIEPADLGKGCCCFRTMVQVLDIALSLRHAERLHSERVNVVNIGFGLTRKLIITHRCPGATGPVRQPAGCCVCSVRSRGLSRGHHPPRFDCEQNSASRHDQRVSVYRNRHRSWAKSTIFVAVCQNPQFKRQRRPPLERVQVK